VKDVRLSTPIHPLFGSEKLTDQEQERRQKLQALRQAGIEPYPARTQRTHTIAQARTLYESGQAGDTHFSLTGRLKSNRIMGKIGFADIEDGSGRIQIVLRRDALPEGWYDQVWKKLVDLGDFIGATGPLSVTKTGELSVNAHSIQFLSKTLKPMPDKWHGVRDQEKRFRRRYVDLIANPEAREIFRTRAKIVSALREYFDRNDFLEVETPILQPIYGGAAAQPFTTYHNQLRQQLYLRISFELYLKRLIVGGFDRVYEIGRDFRNEGVSFKHNPEFTQLEFYEAYADYNDVMRRTEEMIAYVAQRLTGGLTLQWQEHTLNLTPPWKRISLRQAILDASDIDYEAFPDAQALSNEMKRQRIDHDPNQPWGKLVDKLLSHFVEPNLIQPTFLIDYPRDVSPLAKGSPVDPRQVERFEGFMCGMELCNAFSEINDPLDQLQRFVDENYQARHDAEAHPVDEDYVEALSYGMPPTGGFGMGIDRLTMLFTNKDTIREVVLFPHLRSIQEEEDDVI
jgi:lysyl-tRNA synthetase class 2